MKRLLVMFFLTLSILGDLSAATKKGASSMETSKMVPTLFLIQGKSASLTSKGGGNYELTVYDVNHYVFHFADRPNRAAGMIYLSDFLDMWSHGSNSFQRDNPNAGLAGITVMNTGEGQQLMMAVELSKPSYDAKTGKITFQAQILDKKNRPKLPCNLIIEPTLFIDGNFCFSCEAEGV